MDKTIIMWPKGGVLRLGDGWLTTVDKSGTLYHPCDLGHVFSTSFRLSVGQPGGFRAGEAS